MTTDRFTKRPKTENINISLDSWQIHLQRKEKFTFWKGSYMTTPEPPWEPQTSPWTSPGPQKDLKAYWKPFGH